MDLKIALEWDEQCGLSLANVYPFREGIKAALIKKEYGTDIIQIWIVLTCRPNEFKQRKLLKILNGDKVYTVYNHRRFPATLLQRREAQIATTGRRPSPRN